MATEGKGFAASDPRNVPGYAEKHDPVNHPPHYTYDGVECIDVIWEMGHGPGFCLGNAVKYLWRQGHKGRPVEDVKKAKFYLDYYKSKMEKMTSEQQAELATLMKRVQELINERD